MNPKIRHAQRACEAAGARQAVVVWFNEAGQYAVASYGETKAECAAVKPLCDAIADAIDGGTLPSPAGGNRPPSRREREWLRLFAERDEYKARMEAAEKFRETIATLVSIFENQDEPEGQVSARRALTAIAETIGVRCSICRRRHGAEVQHAAE